MRFSALLLLALLLMISGCGKHTYKHFDFEFTEQAYPWGNIAIWTIGTSVNQDEKTRIIGPPYRLVVQFKMHGQVSGCSVGIKSVRLIQADAGKNISLATAKDEKVNLDAPRTGLPRLFDSRDWYSAYFHFEQLELDFVGYELAFNYVFKGNCGKAEGGRVSIPSKKHYVETSDALWYQ